MGEVNALLADVKPWIEHSFYEDVLTRPFAVRLADLCERYTDVKLKLGGSSADADRSEMLRMTWQHYVSRMYTDNQDTLVSDGTIFEVLQQVEAGGTEHQRRAQTWPKKIRSVNQR